MPPSPAHSARVRAELFGHAARLFRLRGYAGTNIDDIMLAAGLTEGPLAKTMGVLAVTLAAVNVFGGFLVTRRMLEMFRKKERPAAPKDGKP